MAPPRRKVTFICQCFARRVDNSNRKFYSDMFSNGCFKINGARSLFFFSSWIKRIELYERNLDLLRHWHITQFRINAFSFLLSLSDISFLSSSSRVCHWDFTESVSVCQLIFTSVIYIHYITPIYYTSLSFQHSSKHLTPKTTWRNRSVTAV